MSSKFERILAIILLLAIVFSALLAINLKPRERFTEFFILNEQGKAGEYPKKLTSGQNSTIIAGIINHEQKKENYLLQVDLDQKKISENNIELSDGEKTMQNITFKPSKTGNQKLELKLYKDNFSSPLSLYLYLEVSP